MKEYIEKYKHFIWKYNEEGGGELTKEMRGWYLLGQVGLDDRTKTIVIGTCSTRWTYEEIKRE